MANEVANIIRSQLDNRFVAMTGAKHFVGTAHSLAFKANRKHVTVTLQPDDLYTVEVSRIKRDYSVECLSLVNDVYADRLALTIGERIGMAVTL